MAVSDTNFIYILSASECQQRNDEEHFKPNKTPNKKSHKLLGHVTKAAGIEVIFFHVFLIPKNESALAGTSRLFNDRSWKSGSIQQRSLT